MKVFGRRPVSDRRRAQNRLEFVDKLPRRVMFTTAGPTGWHRRRDIRGHKGYRTEGDFSDQHHRFTEEQA